MGFNARPSGEIGEVGSKATKRSPVNRPSEMNWSMGSLGSYFTTSTSYTDSWVHRANHHASLVNPPSNYVFVVPNEQSTPHLVQHSVVTNVAGSTWDNSSTHTVLPAVDTYQLDEETLNLRREYMLSTQAIIDKIESEFT